MAITIMWVTWGYFKLRPRGRAISASGHLEHYHAWAYAHLAYSDVAWLYQEHHLFNHALPYVNVQIQYPVVMGIYMWLAAWFQGVGPYFLVSAIGLGACAVGTLLILRQLTPKYYYLFALTPLLLVYSLLNWDLLGIVCMVAGWYTYRRHKYARSGIMFSLGVFAKLFPAFLLFFALLELWRDGEKQSAKRLFTWFAGISLLINLPFAVANPINWGEFYGYNATRSGSSGLLFKLHLAGYLGVSGEDAVDFLLLAAALVIFSMLVYRHRLPVASGAAGLFAVFLVVNKVYSPQYTLWMFLFAIIAEWPAWTAWLLAAGGLIDYYNSFTILFLASDHSPSFAWYFHHIFPLGSDARYATLIATLVVGIRRRLSSGKHIPAPAATSHPGQATSDPDSRITPTCQEPASVNMPVIKRTSGISGTSHLTSSDAAAPAGKDIKEIADASSAAIGANL
ncbi:MAG: glycosyltransferase 87 family protein [Actinobacteria bacterium]|nr:glycosyltransferase 87 family protein [Actinomycetota bacterium]